MPEPNPAAEMQRHLWTIGDYSAVARELNPISLRLLDRLEERGLVWSGSQLLDVGTGNGNAAIAAARRGAEVTGVDLTPAQLALARDRALVEGVDVTFREGDAQDLQLPDASFDAVVSVKGMIFAPAHRAAVQELVRVARPGGHVAVTAWSAHDSWFAAWRAHAGDLMPPAPADGAGPRPDEWGDRATLARRLTEGGLGDVTVEVEPFEWTFGSVEEGMEYFLTTSGPFIAFMDALGAQGRAEEGRAVLADALRQENRAGDGSLLLSAPYLLGFGRR